MSFFEAKLFGYAQCVFKRAIWENQGLLQMASEGIVFWDKIGGKGQRQIGRLLEK